MAVARPPSVGQPPVSLAPLLLLFLGSQKLQQSLTNTGNEALDVLVNLTDRLPRYFGNEIITVQVLIIGRS